MSSTSTQQLKYNWLKNWLELDGISLVDLEKEWLSEHLGRTGDRLQLHYDFMREILRLNDGAYPRSYNDVLKAWLADQGYSGNSLPGILTEYYTDAESLSFQVLCPRLDGTISTEVQRGSGSATFTRATTAMVRDWENVYKAVASGEPRFQGARRVENLAIYSGNATQAPWNPDGGLFSNTNGINKVTSLLGAGFFPRCGVTLSIGRTYTISAKIRSIGLDPTEIRLAQFDGVAWNISSILTMSTDWVKHSYTVTPNGTSSEGAGFYLNGSIGVGFEFDEFQIEDVTAQSNQGPSEYVETFSTAVTKYYTTANGNSVDSTVVTETEGVTLHPVEYKTGARVFANYAPWVASTAYAVGDRIIPTTGSGPAGGNGYYYECTTAGTSDGTEPTWDETVGNTTADNTVTWTNKGYYRIAGYLSEPARTNSILYARDLTNWTQVGTAVSALNAVGIDGKTNSATTLTDNDVVSNERVTNTVTIANDTNTHVSSLFIKKDSDTTRFPSIESFLSGGTDVNLRINFNTQTGATSVRSTAGTVSHRVEDHGSWWRVCINLTNNTTGNTTLNFRVYPAISSVITTDDVTSTGSCIVDAVQVELVTVTPSSPIFTTTATVTRQVDILSYTTANMLDTAGTCLASIRQQGKHHNETGNSRIIAGNAANTTYLAITDIPGATALSFQNYDGTNSLTKTVNPISPGHRYTIGTRFSGSTKQLTAVNLSEISGNYDGNFSTGSTYLGVGYGASVALLGTISNVLLYNKNLGATKLQGLTAYA